MHRKEKIDLATRAIRLGSLLLHGVVIAAAIPTSAEPIALISGETLEAHVISREDGVWRVSHPVLGELDIPAEAIVEPTPEVEDQGMFGSGWLLGWDRQLELGVSGAEGNSNNADLRGGLLFAVERDEHRFKWLTEYFYSRSEGKSTRNHLLSTATRDWLLPDSAWFLFAEARYELDRFEDWDHRVAARLGPGYQFVDTKSWNLRGRLGLGATRTFGGDDDRWTPEGSAGLELGWTINERQSFAAYTTIFPDFSDPGEYRNLAGAAWELSLSDARALNFKIAVENEYETKVEDDTRRNNLRYWGGIVFGF